jgi:hypothetical protein
VEKPEYPTLAPVAADAALQDWFITGAADSRWDDDDLGQLKAVPGGAFEVVDTGETLRH